MDVTELAIFVNSEILASTAFFGGSMGATNVGRFLAIRGRADPARSGAVDPQREAGRALPSCRLSPRRPRECRFLRQGVWRQRPDRPSHDRQARLPELRRLPEGAPRRI